MPLVAGKKVERRVDSATEGLSTMFVLTSPHNQRSWFNPAVFVWATGDEVLLGHGRGWRGGDRPVLRQRPHDAETRGFGEVLRVFLFATVVVVAVLSLVCCCRRRHVAVIDFHRIDKITPNPVRPASENAHSPRSLRWRAAP